ncbi:MAG: low molecular weight phosphotyrosine protein phosphatase [Gammaproteobacteria bacterium]|nr:low molecular weight phosphotyrosine protein phosphatase [Gammaproteobacteria bacterium]MCF6230932.1 low molecular weight phosphotyrosine protein phosphatase [Gammaproteobacteria bacterium]
MKKVGVIFVCMGNICRSPTAEGVFRTQVVDRGLADLFEIDSAGTHAYHDGEGPDPRAKKLAKQRGVELGDVRARRVTAEDIEHFDYILAMDGDNHLNLMKLAPEGHEHKVRRILEFTSFYSERDVPDPYYGGPRGFERVYDLIESASEGLLDVIVTTNLKT